MKSLYETIFDKEASLETVIAKPHSKRELQQIIDEHVKRLKPKPGDEVGLNWIDISDVDDLSFLFQNTLYIPVIDAWKIDHVKKFAYMFTGNEHITRSPLPVLQENLKDKRCYSLMFYDCKNLKEPPELPATELTERCYANMFRDCTSLEVAPELPAKELAPNCYRHMFKGCSKLKTRAKVPTGVSLDGHTALDMYAGCQCKNIKNISKKK